MEKDDIKERLTISQVLTFYGAKRAKGEDSWFCCFHDDNDPSLIANDKRGIATCQSTNCDLPRGSDIFQVLKFAENCNLNEAIKKSIAMIDQPLFTQAPQ